MLKPSSLRAHITAAVPELARDPERLVVLARAGRTITTGTAALSFEYAYTLQMIVLDYAGHADAVMVPLLAWLKRHQPELMTNDERRKEGITFEAEYLANDLMDLIITVKLTERVRVWQNEQGIGWEHLPEPPEDPYDGITWELFINGEYQPWPPTN